MRMKYCLSCGEEKNNNRTKYCETCHAEHRRVKNNCWLAQKMGLVGDLTLGQWLKTLHHFNWRCAYCQEIPFHFIEHFIPLSLQGGTTVSNCVPACKYCNNKKKDKHPDTVTNVKIDHVRKFLATQK